MAAKKAKSTNKETNSTPTVKVNASALCQDGKEVRIEMRYVELGLVQALRPDVDISLHNIYLDRITLGTGATKLEFESPNTGEMAEHYESLDDGKCQVGVSEFVIVHTDGLISVGDRDRLLKSTGKTCGASLSFRVNGESDALVEGKDFKWLRRFKFIIVSSSLEGEEDERLKPNEPALQPAAAQSGNEVAVAKSFIAQFVAKAGSAFVNLYSRDWLLSAQTASATASNEVWAERLPTSEVRFNAFITEFGEGCLGHLLAFVPTEKQRLGLSKKFPNAFVSDFPPAVGLINLKTSQILCFGLGKEGGLFTEHFPSYVGQPSFYEALNISGVPFNDVELNITENAFARDFIALDHCGIVQQLISACLIYGYYSRELIQNHPRCPDPSWIEDEINSPDVVPNQWSMWPGLRKSDLPEHLKQVRILVADRDYERGTLSAILPELCAFKLDPDHYNPDLVKFCL